MNLVVIEEHQVGNLVFAQCNYLYILLKATSACIIVPIAKVPRFKYVKKQPSQDVLHGDEAEEELGLARLVSSYTLPHQNSQPGGRGRQMARSKVLSRRTRDT